MQENLIDLIQESDVDIENMIQVTPVTSIKKQRKRKCEENDMDEIETEDIKKEFEKNGCFYYEKPKKLFHEKTNKKIVNQTKMSKHIIEKEWKKTTMKNTFKNT